MAISAAPEDVQPNLLAMTTNGATKPRFLAELSSLVGSGARVAHASPSRWYLPQARLSTSPNTCSMISSKNFSASGKPHLETSAFLAHSVKTL